MIKVHLYRDAATVQLCFSCTYTVMLLGIDEIQMHFYHDAATIQICFFCIILNHHICLLALSDGEMAVQYIRLHGTQKPGIVKFTPA